MASRQQVIRISLVFLVLSPLLLLAWLELSTTTPWGTEPAKGLKADNSAARPLAEQPTATRYDVVLTCLYISKGFYVGRKVPPLSWALVFILSLYKNRRSETSGLLTKLVIYSDPSTAEMLRGKIQEHLGNASHGFVEIVDIDWRVKYAGVPWANMTRLRNAANNFRFALFQEYIEAHLNALDRVMVSDITDVVFQKNPFDGGCAVPTLSNRPIVRFTLEYAKKTFSNERYNRRWMSGYPKDVLKWHLRGRPISCDGVTIGTARGMVRYHELMMKEIRNEKLTECSIETLNAALDQANHNYILHVVGNPATWKGEALGIEAWTTWMHEACAYHGNWIGPHMKGVVVVNASMEVYPIVHQYTSCRRPALMKIFHDQYLPGEDLESCNSRA